MLRFSMGFSAVVSLCLAAQGQDLESEMDKQSYSVGVQLGKAIANGKESLNIDVMFRGFMDTLEGKDLEIPEEECVNHFRMWQEVSRKQQEEKMQGEGTAFLAENGKRAGVVTLPSGLQYEVLKEGTGATPTRDSTIRAHYAGTLVDGTEFDSSYRRNEPLELGVTQVIPGWTEALLLMKEGAKWKLYIPSELGYGARGAGATIPPHSTLIFEMELIEVVK